MFQSFKNDVGSLSLRAVQISTVLMCKIGVNYLYAFQCVLMHMFFGNDQGVRLLEHERIRMITVITCTC